MHNRFPLLLAFLAGISTCASGQRTVRFNTGYENVSVRKGENITVPLSLKKGTSYQLMVEQLGIDIRLILRDEKGTTLLEKDSPNGSRGLETAEYLPKQNGQYQLVIERLDESGNAQSGFVNYYIRQYTPTELEERERTKKKLEEENSKNVLTLDIDHFWEAYDHLRYARSRWDSVLTFQHLYFDRATNGLQDFIAARQWTPDQFVRAVARWPRYYASVRPYTEEAKKSAPLIEEVFQQFKQLYGNFEPFKVCFGIGFRNTGGTVSNRFVLLGTEMVTAGKNVDFSEGNPAWKPDPAKKEPNIPASIKGIVAHECVHTQQPGQTDSLAVQCPQLYSCLREGAANFVAELITGKSGASPYGEAHETALWKEFKSTLCRDNANLWLYNGGTSKDRPSDLGYYIGYKICQAYYRKATDKRLAVKEIIELKDPLSFLVRSGYDGPSATSEKR
ncbi:DUF2268 domain-containing putative Zn-dependent protease [Siphonobacter aquaeclarae]|uniref:Predicted Zn-dependent protease n=1 Tax=Siphonobacter aquaeclarae TaxID=563176 RepID=A0A1G9RRT8_9BACT|nr:DUF2268 domain-containing putative Zn-dependent protease [Siphonobacter aquaeclarae]SDM26038.1 Predicted Zn-dependent protease [Siphonobacter aquaeclarae]